MFIERIYDTDLAHASYVIGCPASGEALVLDPRRDIEVYRQVTRDNKLTIVAVTETHVHADYLSGTRELAAATGAPAYVSGEGGPDWLYQFDAEVLHHGDKITIGNVVLEAVHTPGHTPEHLSFLVTDGAAADEPGYLFSGDFVFAGDLGRPDLLDEVTGGEDTRYIGAEQLFSSLRDRFLQLPDYVQVFPAHGAGSACGKSLGAVPSTTVGYERTFSWWAKYLESDDEAAFTRDLLDGQPEAPGYFARMKVQNIQGPAILGERPMLSELSAERVALDLADDSVVFVDTREKDEVHDETVVGAINIPARQLATYGAWAIDPETDTRPLVLLADDQESAQSMWDHLIRVGIDQVSGYVTSIESLPTTSPTVVSPSEVSEFPRSLLLDVRAQSEYDDGAVPGATLLHGSRILWNLDELPDEGPILTYCRTGVRSSVVASVLRNRGYETAELAGGYTAWAANSSE